MKKNLKRVFSINLQSGYRNYTVRDLLELKGKKKLTQINVTSPEEASAAEEAGIDLITITDDELFEVKKRNSLIIEKLIAKA